MENKISVRRWTRILPIACIIYTIAYMDRVNVGFAFSGMQESLGFGATISGLVGGIFFIGYLFLDIPGGHLAARGSAKKFVFWSLILWGVFAVACGFVQNLPQLLIVRFLLGVCEGGVWPAILVLLAKWFPLKERARANAWFMMCLPLASIIMSPLSGWLLQISDWRWLFIIEGSLPFVGAILWWIIITDEPKKANWLPKMEKDYILNELEMDRKNTPSESITYRKTFLNKSVWIMCLSMIFMQIGNYGFTLWIPTIVKSVTHSGNIATGFISAIPFVAGAIGLHVNGWHSDLTGERKKHASIAVIVGSILMFISGGIGNHSAIWSIAVSVVAYGFCLSFIVPFWAIPGEILPKETLGGALGLLNAIGSIGGFLGSFIVGWIIQSTGSLLIGMGFLSACMVAAGVLILFVRTRNTTHTKTSVLNTRQSEI